MPQTFSPAVLNRYLRLQNLGEGATSEVELARDTQTQALVAIKRLRTTLSPLSTTRLRREYEALKQLDHPNIVRVFEFGSETNPPYLVLEYVQGRDFNQWLERMPDLEAVTRVFVHLADALEQVHDLGLVHRDLKPQNIRIDFHNQPKLLDFGLTKPLRGDPTAITRLGALVGTALFMAPEQCRAEAIDARTDLYALGGLMYFAYTGQPPFISHDPIQVMRQHLESVPRSPLKFNKDLPVMLEQLILRLLAKNPGDRPQTAREVRETLEQLLAMAKDVVGPLVGC